MKIAHLKNQVFQNPLMFLAFGFGSGLLPFAPGTWGTLVALPLYFLLAHLSKGAYIIVVLLLFAAGIYICQKASDKLGVHDHSGIVWDEISGFLLTLWMIPSGIKWLILAFILFRLFDILKPQPIAYCDANIQGGFGIMFDDFLAGFFAFIVIQVTAWSIG